MRRPRIGGIAVDGAGQVVDELDDELGQVVGRRRLAGEEERPRRHLEVRILAQPVVEHHDAQRIEQLPLVFVDALDLAIEDGVRVHRLTGGRLEPVGKLRLGFALGLAEGVAKALSSASGSSLRSWPRSVIQPSPMASVIVRASAGFASSSQRRGVTPLVLLLKRSGNISARSLTVVVRSSSE